jgi:hypothetical protein
MGSRTRTHWGEYSQPGVVCVLICSRQPVPIEFCFLKYYIGRNNRFLYSGEIVLATVRHSFAGVSRVRSGVRQRGAYDVPVPSRLCV